MVFSFGLATVLVAHQTPATSLAEFLSMRVKVGNFALFALFLLAWHVVFSSFGLYSSKRFSSRWAEVLDVVEGGHARVRPSYSLRRSSCESEW